MPKVTLGGLNCYDLARILKLLPSNNTETSKWHARPFAITFQTAAYCLIG
jgi:hypothetical protein